MNSPKHLVMSPEQAKAFEQTLTVKDIIRCLCEGPIDLAEALRYFGLIAKLESKFRP